MKNQIRKMLSLSLAAVMALSLTACGVGGTAEAPAAPEAAVEETVETAAVEAVEEAADAHYTVGICQLVQLVAREAAIQVFKDAIGG